MKKLLPAAIILVLWAPVAAAKDIYVRQNSAGSDTGADCANAHAMTFFNTAGNWGAGASQIGPGTTVHLCGTISTNVVVQGSGAAGNKITIYFESNAKISMPTCNTICLEMNGKSYIVVDGGANGIIEATNNGTTLGSQNADVGINCTPCPNAEIRNLTFQNLFVPGQTGGFLDTREYGTGVFLYHPANSNIRIHHNTFTSTGYKGVLFLLSGTESNNEIDHNLFYALGWGIVYADGNSGVNASGVGIHGNEFNSTGNWCGATDGSGGHHHLDPIHIWAVQNPPSTISGVSVYNNYIHGDFCQGNTTAGIFVESGPGTITGDGIFNNLIVAEAGYPTDAMIEMGRTGGGTLSYYNNTLDCVDNTRNCTGLYLGNNNQNQNVQNNIVMNSRIPLTVETGVTLGSSGINQNLYYNVGNLGWKWHGTFYNTFAAWKTACGCDANGLQANPNLTSTYQPTPGSPAIGAGANLTSLGITALDSDKAGSARPPSGAWDLGAYSRATLAPNPPRNLNVQ